MVRALVILLAFCVTAGYSIGFDHGTFRSQSTQGPTWTGTATIIKEDMKITVYQYYLDVELEWVFKAGGTAPSQYADALEIVGNLNLERGSVLVGMVLWYKGMMLKAKLKSKAKARQEYEEVVDRNSPVPPRPRDPVIVEYLGNDNYDISIFPVDFLGTRRLRMRFLVPATGQTALPRMGFPHAFTAGGTVTIVKGLPLRGFSVLMSNGLEGKEIADSTVLTKAMAYGSSPYPLFVVPKVNSQSTKTCLYAAATGNIFLPGQFVYASNFAVAHILESVKTLLAGMDSQTVKGTLGVYACVGDGTVRCSTGVSSYVADVSKIGSDVKWTQGMYLYSSSPVKREIAWHVFLNGEPLIIATEQPDYAESFCPAIESKVIAGSRKIISLDQELPKSMAATFGFVDTGFAMLALEEDVLPSQLASYYANTGVPVFNQEDIFADSADVLLIPANGLYQPNSYDHPLTGAALPDILSVNRGLFDLVKVRCIGGRLLISIEGSVLERPGDFEIAVYSPSGRCLKVWRKSALLSGRSVEWSPRDSGISSGALIVRVKSGSVCQSRTVSLL